MNDTLPKTTSLGKWMALAAALLGWLFDGLEMGLFPLVANPALRELGVPAERVVAWNGVITALFLVGAATGGVLFGWLGDRLGRVRAMMLSVLTYALVTGVCGFATAPWQIGALRFVAALGMGGEWSLGVALINEIWPDRSRAFLAGLIGAAANVGYLIIALVGRGLTTYVREFRAWLLEDVRASEATVEFLLGPHQSGWRLLMMLGALPALLTFFIRLFVPESQRWEQERAKGATSHWANRDLLAVLAGSLGACGVVAAWAASDVDLHRWVGAPWALPVRITATVLGLIVVTVGYIYPVAAFVSRLAQTADDAALRWPPIIRRMLLAACLSGVALLGTWGTTQQAPTWADQVTADPSTRQSTLPTARSDTQIWSAIGAVVGTILAALVADLLGRRLTYTLLCLGSLAIIPTLFLTTTPHDGAYYLLIVFLAGAITASFYGWLPLYLPELFRTSMRATGQGFGFNFGRVIAAIGVLQLGNLKALFQPLGWGDGHVFTLLSGIYLVGIVLIWFAPETKGKPLPE
ncbi:MAG: MFS transporter [Gemmataceae bacterium]|nr:MFS transporter [Gemmataceae bacterium]